MNFLELPIEIQTQIFSYCDTETFEVAEQAFHGTKECLDNDFFWEHVYKLMNPKKGITSTIHTISQNERPSICKTPFKVLLDNDFYFILFEKESSQMKIKVTDISKRNVCVLFEENNFSACVKCFAVNSFKNEKRLTIACNDFGKSTLTYLHSFPHPFKCCHSTQIIHMDFFNNDRVYSFLSVTYLKNNLLAIYINKKLELSLGTIYQYRMCDNKIIGNFEEFYWGTTKAEFSVPDERAFKGNFLIYSDASNYPKDYSGNLFPYSLLVGSFQLHSRNNINTKIEYSKVLYFKSDPICKPFAKTIYAASSEGCLHIITENSEDIIKISDAELTALSVDKQWIAVGYNGGIDILRRTNLKRRFSIQLPASIPDFIHINGRQVIVGSTEGTLKLFDIFQDRITLTAVA